MIFAHRKKKTASLIGGGGETLEGRVARTSDGLRMKSSAQVDVQLAV